MKNKFYFQLGYGGIEAFLVAVVIGLAMYFYFYPTKFPKYVPGANSTTPFCRPYLNEDGTIKDDAPTIMAPTYEYGSPYPKLHPDDIQPYRLIKSRVPLKSSDFTSNYSAVYLHNQVPNEIHCEQYIYNGVHHSHFCQWIHEPLKVEPNLSGGYQYVVSYPAPYSDGNVTIYNGGSDPFNSEIGPLQSVRYGTYNLIFLLHIDEQNKPYVIARGTDELEGFPYYAVDVYQQVKPDDHSQPVNTVPESVLKCIDSPLTGSGFTLGPVIEKSPDKKQEQLGWFVPQQNIVQDTWYEPACKPAINLYPQKDTLVNVQVSIPNGFLTYTDPLYSSRGWSVLAKPSGQLQYLGSNFADSRGVVNYPTGIFPYLYYEGKIADTAVTKPEAGFVTKYEELNTMFDELLPKLGLNQKESQEFKDYWLKALPYASYYFIGIIPQEQLNENEPLTITPKEDTMIRVRLYFEALDEWQSVKAPELQRPARSGFTVVDWGGMVKRDKDHPFTCLQ